jgi:hypothetical protein
MSGMRDVMDRTIRNWRWWLAILPITLLMIPLVALDVVLKLLCYLARETDNYADQLRWWMARRWSVFSGPVRRWAFQRATNSEGPQT